MKKVLFTIFIIIISGKIYSQNMVVSLASGANNLLNGEYVETGVKDGHPYYQKGSDFIYFVTGDVWVLDSQFEWDGSTSHLYFYIFDASATPDGLVFTNAGVLGSGDFPRVDIAAPLPVELTSFTAQLSELGVNLSWQTATEVNNYGFEVERKQSDLPTDGEWKTLGFVPGHGNSNSPKTYSYSDDLLEVTSDSLEYRLKQIDTDGKFEYYSLTAKVDVSIVTEVLEEGFPTKFDLSQNYPNPFNPTTQISYSVKSQVEVRMSVFNSLGEEIRTFVNTTQPAGNYTIQFDASNLPSGIYFYRIIAGEFVASKKMILLK